MFTNAYYLEHKLLLLMYTFTTLLVHIRKNFVNFKALALSHYSVNILYIKTQSNTLSIAQSVKKQAPSTQDKEEKMKLKAK